MDRDAYINRTVEEFKRILAAGRPINKQLGIFIKNKITGYLKDHPNEPVTPFIVDVMTPILASEEIRQPALDLRSFVKYVTIGSLLAARELKREYNSVAFQIPKLVFLKTAEQFPEETIIRILKGFAAALASLSWVMIWRRDLQGELQRIIEGVIAGLNLLLIPGKKKEAWIYEAFNIWGMLYDSIVVFVFTDGFWPLTKG